MEYWHQVNTILSNLLEEIDEDKFQRTLKQFLSIWKSRCPKFIDFFEKTYASEKRAHKPFTATTYIKGLSHN